MGVALSGIAEMSWEPTSAVCHAWGACEMPTVSYRKSFLQQGGDLCFSGDFYMGELQRSDCQECLESPGQWLGDEALGQSCRRLSLVRLCFVTLLLLDGQDALTFFDQLHSAVCDEPDGQGADRETYKMEGDVVILLLLLA